MGFASFLNLSSKVDGFGCGFFVFCSFSQILNLFFLVCLLALSLKFLLFKCPSSFLQSLEKLHRVSPKIECCSSFDQDNNRDGFGSKYCLVDELDQKKASILHWDPDSADELKKSCENCDKLLLSDELNLRANRDTAPALSETEESEDEEESREDQVFDVITLRKMVKRERKRGDGLKKELEKERRAAESAAEEAMAMLLKLRLEKSTVEMEANQYKRVAEQKQVYDQEVIQSLQWMLMKLDDGDNKIQD